MRVDLRVESAATAAMGPTDSNETGFSPARRRGVKKVPKRVASLARGGPGSALLTDASRAAGVRLAFADF